MSDADREWTIEHDGAPLCDIVSLLDCDETSVENMESEPITVEQVNGARLSRLWTQAGEFARLSRQRAGVRVR